MTHAATDLCPSCNVPFENHDCPVKVGTVGGTLVSFVANGQTVTKVAKVASRFATCVRCNRVHHNTATPGILCVTGAAIRHYGLKTIDANANDIYTYAMDYLAYEAANGGNPCHEACCVKPVKPVKTPPTPKQSSPVSAPATVTSTPSATVPNESPADRKKRLKAGLKAAK